MKKRTNKLIVNRMYLIEYRDASYSYIDIIKKKIPVAPLIISTGKVRRITDVFLDLSVTWYEEKEKIEYVDGIIIPLKVIEKAIEINK